MFGLTPRKTRRFLALLRKKQVYLLTAERDDFTFEDAWFSNGSEEFSFDEIASGSRRHFRGDVVAALRLVKTAKG
jgi:hypothetical protein